MLLDFRSLWEGTAAAPQGSTGGIGARVFVSWGPKLRYRPDEPDAILAAAFALGLSREEMIALYAAAEDGELIF
jgi:hypothetical protein